MSDKKPGPIAFDLHPEHSKALETIAGSRQVRLSGSVKNGKFVVNFIACNSPFVACNSPFTACNAPFTACNAPFTACNAPFTACNAPFKK